MSAGHMQLSVAHGETLEFVIAAKDANGNPLALALPAKLLIGGITEYPLISEATNEITASLTVEQVEVLTPDSYRMEIWATLEGDYFQLIVGRLNVRKSL